MNLMRIQMRIYQCLCPFIFLALHPVYSELGDKFEQCPNAPTELDKVEAVIYLNGENMCDGNDNTDYVLFRRICSWQPYFKASVLNLNFKVGADVTCDGSDESDGCTCMSSGQETDCEGVFQAACLAHLIDKETFYNFLCCQSLDDMSMDQCLTETQVNTDTLQECIDEGKGQELAVNNAEDVADFDMPEGNSEPFIVYGENGYDYCLDVMGYEWWAQTVCSMLTKEAYDETAACQRAWT